MKLGIIVTGLFVMIGLFLFVWYHVERMQDELEQLDRLDHKDNK
jgi:hypothetical protein